MKKLAHLYGVFFSLGLCTFGGGYAMLSLLQKVIVEKYHWADEEELMDYYAIGQCTPGIIAVNTSTFIGDKVAGVGGALAATLGFLSPSIIIVMLIAMFLKNFASLAIVSHAFGGIRVCVCVLILDAVIKLGKKSLTDHFAWLVFGAVFLLSLFTNIQTAFLVILAGVAGYVRGVLKHETSD